MSDITFHDWIAIAVLILSFTALLWIAHRANCRARKREVDRAEAERRAHIERVERVRRFLANRPVKPAPRPGINPGPGLRPHPVQAARERDESSPWVIPPSRMFEPRETPQCGLDTADSDTRVAAVITTLSIPMPEGSGEFSGSGASGSWDASPAGSPPRETDMLTALKWTLALAAYTGCVLFIARLLGANHLDDEDAEK